MNIATYRPFDLFARLERELNGRSTATSESPTTSFAVDIREEVNRFVLRADLPGVEPKDIEVSVDKGVLTIRGERVGENSETDEKAGYTRIERNRGAFERRFTLPDSVDADAIEAASSNGVLTLTVPKRAEVQPRRIAVH
ncbi:MAG: Hsp20/alpha crystallin family protein [Chromatiales bacterium]|nr:Hsp20/alpha crystallin family protein [Chromatiales bacterium]